MSTMTTMEEVVAAPGRARRLAVVGDVALLPRGEGGNAAIGNEYERRRRQGAKQEDVLLKLNMAAVLQERAAVHGRGKDA